MSTIEISKKTDLRWAGASALAFLLSLGLGIGIGPVGIYLASALGLLFVIVGFARSGKHAAAFTLLTFHLLLIIAGAVLDSLFLQALPDNALKMPRLVQAYHDPDGLFDLRAPANWTLEPIHTATESGVRMRPPDRLHYMGISELAVRVKVLSNPTSDPVRFLSKMATDLSNKPRNTSKLFEFSTRPARLLNGGHGMWSHLIVKRFWVPLYQLALYGIKDRRYLCTVSASGLKYHATLSEVVCLGVYETIHIVHRERS